jgi:phosphate transport system protein
MPKREHTSKQYERQLRDLQDKLNLIGRKAESAISDAMRALLERSAPLARQVIAQDDQLDELEVEIDKICLEMLIREQPVASDLRFITTAMKIVANLERVGDNGVSIARRALEIMQEPEQEPIVDLPVVASAAQRLLRESLDAFDRGDVELAKRVIRDNKDIDSTSGEMLQKLLAYMLKNQGTINHALRLMFVARSLERVGDHASNIAEMGIFLVQGQDVRHGQTRLADSSPKRTHPSPSRLAR